MLQSLAVVLLASAVVARKAEPAKTAESVPIETLPSESVVKTVKTPEAHGLHSMSMHLHLPYSLQTSPPPESWLGNDHLYPSFKSNGNQPEIWDRNIYSVVKGPKVDEMDKLNKQRQQRYEFDRKYEEENKLLRMLLIAEQAKMLRQLKQQEEKRYLTAIGSPSRGILQEGNSNTRNSRNGSGYNGIMNNERNGQGYRGIMNKDRNGYGYGGILNREAENINWQRGSIH